MTKAKAAKPLFACERHTYRAHGYEHTRIAIWRGVEQSTIAEQIRLSGTKGHYRDQDVADRMVAHYTRLQEQGVTHVFETFGSERITLDFLHCDSGRFCMHVQLPESPREIDKAYKLWSTVRPRLLRAMGRDPEYTYPLEYDCTPDLVMHALTGLKCLPIAALRTELCSMTYIYPTKINVPTQWSFV